MLRKWKEYHAEWPNILACPQLSNSHAPLNAVMDLPSGQHIQERLPHSHHPLLGVLQSPGPHCATKRETYMTAKARPAPGLICAGNKQVAARRRPNDCFPALHALQAQSCRG